MVRRRAGMGRRRGPVARPAMRRQMRRGRRRRRRRRMLVGGAIVVGAGALAYKLGKGQAQQIEQRTGVPLEEMSDEEIQGAMNDLGMQGEPLTEADNASLEAEKGSSDEPAYLAELERLAELRDKGIISEEEFAAKKKQLLGL